MLSETRHKALLESQTSTARKVYSSVPIAEDWTCKQIHTEMLRIGTGRELSVTQGCLATLTRAGLVQEVKRGIFRRAPVRLQNEVAANDGGIEYADTSAPTEEVEMPTNTPAKPANHMQIMDDLSRRATEMAAALRDLAHDIEAAAIAIDEQMQVEGANTEKLKQLQALLKSL